MSEKLVAALLDQSNWPHPVTDLRCCETHISWVILAGEYAYKIKKPVRLEFLDFSTLALRRHWCEEELRLNRRWAPELYLDVVAITGSPAAPRVGGDGEPIEYAVRMRRFDQSALLSEQLANGELDAHDMTDLAEMLADRHARAPANREERFGGLAAIRKPMAENFVYLEPWLETGELRRFERWTDDELDRHRAFIDARRRDGFVRECHGDLHLRNLVRLDDGIVAFDCIEFSDELRMLDVVSDTSFVAMDLVAEGRGDLAWIFLNRYLERSGDYAGMRLYGLYFVYHCLIRAKVAAIRASERRQDNEREQDLETMRHYCDVASGWIRESNPALIVMHGLSGSGKTWLSTQLLAALGAVRIRSDVERKRLYGLAERASTNSAPGKGLYGTERSRATYQRLLDIAAGLLAAGQRVILDAAFLDAAERERARTLAGSLGVPYALVAVEAPYKTMRSRLVARQAAGSDASEGDTDVLDWQAGHADPVDDALEAPVLHFVSSRDADAHRTVAALKKLVSQVPPTA